MSHLHELRAQVSAEMADRLEAFFFETETTYWGVMQRGRDDPYEVFGFFPDPATAASQLGELRREFPDLPETFEETDLPDADWQNAYKAYVKAWNDRMLHWVPLWERDHVRPPEGAAVVYLDAGMAFGTGAHETTRLCAGRLIDFLEAGKGQFAEGAEVIDAGCGSGVLAFSATALGFPNVYAFDNDPEAIRVCHENAAENDHLPPPEFAVAGLEDALSGRKADLLLANIQTDVLCPNADFLLQALKPDGVLALSGILSKELTLVRDRFQERCEALFPGAKVTVDSRVDGEWADLFMALGEPSQC